VSRGLRTCVGCRAVRPQADLIRIARDAAGGVGLMPRRWAGRTAYLCRSPGCLERALARKALPRALRAPLPGLDAAQLAQALRRVLAQGAAAIETSTPDDAGGSAAGGPGGL
jgi:predicted RNA-binding protein YlxR (DUF448 family)